MANTSPNGSIYEGRRSLVNLPPISSFWSQGEKRKRSPSSTQNKHSIAERLRRNDFQIHLTRLKNAVPPEWCSLCNEIASGTCGSFDMGKKEPAKNVILFYGSTWADYFNIGGKLNMEDKLNIGGKPILDRVLGEAVIRMAVKDVQNKTINES